MFWNKNSGFMVKFIVLILTMPGVKLLVYVEIMNEDVCRLHLTLCIVFFIKLLVFNSSPKYWSWGFQFEQFVNFTSSTQKNPGPTYQDGISRIKNRGNACLAQEISWGNDSDSYSMWKRQEWIRKRKEFLEVDQGKPMLDFQWVFLPLNFCKHLKGFCRNQILSKL